MLVTSKELLLDAQKNHYAVGAFNVENMEMVMAVLAAAERTKIPVVMHLDHGNSFAMAMQAFRAGYISIAMNEVTAYVAQKMEVVGNIGKA